MKAAAQKQRRDIFVLTAEEKRVLCFVVAIFVLGLTVKHYRKTHSNPLAKTAVVEAAKNAGLPAEKRAEAKRRRAAR